MIKWEKSFQIWAADNKIFHMVWKNSAKELQFENWKLTKWKKKHPKHKYFALSSKVGTTTLIVYQGKTLNDQFAPVRETVYDTLVLCYYVTNN